MGEAELTIMAASMQMQTTGVMRDLKHVDALLSVCSSICPEAGHQIAKHALIETLSHDPDQDDHHEHSEPEQENLQGEDKGKMHEEEHRVGHLFVFVAAVVRDG